MRETDTWAQYPVYICLSLAPIAVNDNDVTDSAYSFLPMGEKARKSSNLFTYKLFLESST